MKLHKFKIHRRKTCTGCHSHTIPCSNRWIRSVKIGLTRPSGSKQNDRSGDRDHTIMVSVVKINTKNLVVIPIYFNPKFSSFPCSNQIDGKVMLKKGDSLFRDISKKGSLNGFASDIFYM